MKFFVCSPAMKISTCSEKVKVILHGEERTKNELASFLEIPSRTFFQPHIFLIMLILYVTMGLFLLGSGLISLSNALSKRS